jgi:acyl-CoA thioesterase
MVYLQYVRTLKLDSMHRASPARKNHMLDRCEFQPDGSLVAPMDPDFATFKGAFGGWTAAHVMLTAYPFQIEGLEPISLSIDFLRGIQAGDVISTPMLLHETRGARFLSIITTQMDTPCAASSVIFASRPQTASVQGVLMPECAPPEQAQDVVLPPSPNTWTEQFQMRSAMGTPFVASPGMRTLFWMRPKNAYPKACATIAALADASIPRIFFHFEQPSLIATFTMSVHFHARTAELEMGLNDFVLIEAMGQAARSGVFDQQLRIWARSGLLLATSTQLVRYNVPAHVNS